MASSRTRGLFNRQWHVAVKGKDSCQNLEVSKLESCHEIQYSLGQGAHNPLGSCSQWATPQTSVTHKCIGFQI